jgi:hypothetical protein
MKLELPDAKDDLLKQHISWWRMRAIILAKDLAREVAPIDLQDRINFRRN